MKFLIIGGDAAGMSAASRAKRLKPDIDVTVLEQTHDVSYSACGMPYNIADTNRPVDDLVVRKAETFRQKQGIELLTGHRAERIDTGQSSVSGNTINGEAFAFSYDKLLIATGASPIKPGIPGNDLPGVMTLKSLNDGRTIKDFLTHNKVRKVVVVGMGYIGLEMCEAFRTRDIEVDMVSLEFMPGFNSDISAVVRESVVSHSIGLYEGQSVKQIEKSGSDLRVTCSDAQLQGDMVLMSIGIRPNSNLAADAGLLLGASSAISVDKQTKTSNEDIFAAGDCADAFHLVTGQKTWIPLALRANRAGWAVADNVCGIQTELPGITGTAVFKVFDLQVARTGLNADEALKAGFSPAEVLIKSRSRAHAHPGSADIWVYMVGDKKSGRLLGVQMAGTEGVAHRINAPAVALYNQMSVWDFLQTDLAYAPPFGPVWDPVLTAANQLLKDL